MKIEQKKEFTPVTITLDTPEEVGVFWEMFGQVINGGEVREFCNEVYEELTKYVDSRHKKQCHYFFSRKAELPIDNGALNFDKMGSTRHN